jgi:hypothetical protein
MSERADVLDDRRETGIPAVNDLIAGTPPVRDLTPR